MKLEKNEIRKNEVGIWNGDLPSTLINMKFVCILILRGTLNFYFFDFFSWILGGVFIVIFQMIVYPKKLLIYNAYY